MNKGGKHDNIPPKLADRFLSWFCKDNLLEEVKGDLFEYYQMEREVRSKWRSNVSYWFHAFHFLRPFALKKIGQNSNTIIMYRSHFKFAWRNMRKHKVNSLMNMLSLSVGMACFVFIFIYIKGELSYDRFHDDADLVHRVVIDLVESDGEILPDATTPPALAPALQANFGEIEKSVRIFPSWGNKFLMGVNEEQKFYEESVIRADANFFDVFSFPFIYGDPATSLSNPGQLVVTRSTALKYFNRIDVIGEVLTIFSMDNAKWTITGVIEDVPYNSHFKFDFLSSLTFENIDENWGWWNYYTYVKLIDGVDAEQFESKLPEFYKTSRPGQDNYAPIYTQAIADIHLNSNLKWELEANGNMSNIYIFGALGVFVLLISCMNFLNLTVANSIKRLKEVGLRKVFGAQRTSLISQFLVEALLIVFLSLAIGSLLAELLFKNLGNTLGYEVSIFNIQNLPALGIIGLGGILIGLVAGLYPAIHLSSFQVSNAVKGIVSKTGKSALGLRQTLLVIQFAISAIMIIGTLVVFKQLKHIQNVDLGFESEQVIVIENARGVANQLVFRAELEKLSNVSGTGASSGVLGGLNSTTTLGYPDGVLMNYSAVDPEYMETMDFEFVAGRNFSRDITTDAQGMNFIVNVEGLKGLGLTMEDIGKPRPMYSENDTIRNGTVLGVVKDFRFTDFKSEIKPFGFFFREGAQSVVNVKLSTADVSQTIYEIEQVWNAVSNGAPFEYFFLDAQFAQLNDQEEKLSSILVYLTFLAIFIAFIGMFAIANMTIKDKLKEIAIRKVLGASINGVSAMITKKFILLVLLANVIAAPIAYFLMQSWLESFVSRTSVSAIVFVVVIASTLAIAWLTVGFQSIRAAMSNPVNSLRQD